jgi:anti-sigma regulatory factor (Ser/Thr protein kinase)
MKESREKEIPDDMVQPARADAIPALVEFVCAHAWETGFDDERIREIGLATEEALNNIIRFACRGREAEIHISCGVHDSGALFVHITDTGEPFNMLLASTFPEANDFVEAGQVPSTRLMKRTIKNIEYIRGSDKNSLIFVVSKDTAKG